MANTKKFWYLSLLPVNIQMLIIKKADPDLYLLNKETKYISFIELIKIGVLVACTNQSKANQRSSNKPVK